MQNISSLSSPQLVMGTYPSGRRRFDQDIKQKLIDACLAPGASLVSLALEHDIHVNLLRKWVRERCQQQNPLPAFVPVVQTDHPIVQTAPCSSMPAILQAEDALQPLSSPQLTVSMPNGIVIKLDGFQSDPTLVSALIDTLGRCDVSTRS